MDSLENKQEAAALPTTEPAAQPNEETQDTTTQPTTSAEAMPQADTEVPLTKEQIVAKFEELLAQPVGTIKAQADVLKQSFYKLFNAEQEKLRAAFAEAGNAVEEFEATTDEIEQKFRALLQEYKEKRAAENARIEAERAQHKLKKENILAQMKDLAESETADVSGSLNRFHELQQEWRSVGQVAPTDVAELQKQYDHYQNQFYDLVHINNQLRDYDFKKNLEAKTALCEQAEKLDSRTDIVGAFRDLQKLHEEWANIGPVARELREDLWARFKAASTVINKRHQDFFLTLHAQEEENLQQKRDICDQIEAITSAEFTSYKQWDEATEKVAALQAAWRKLGFAPRKENQKIFERYRSLCDNFYASKTAYYKQVKSDLNSNLEKKRSLVERAQALKDSTEWKKTSDILVQLQQDWKNIGAVPRKYSEDLWKQFTEACDHFFDQKKAANSDQHQAERDNLAQKKAIIAEIENLPISQDANTTLKALKALIAKYNEIGFVPFRDKDKIYKQFKAATDKIYDQLHVDAANRRLDAFTQNIEEANEDRLLTERRRLLRQYDSLKAEIATAENNIGFFTAKSSKSNGLITDMQRKIAAQKEQLVEIEKKIGLIDEKL